MATLFCPEIHKTLHGTVDNHGNLMNENSRNETKLIKNTKQETKDAINKILNTRLIAAQEKSDDFKLIKYRPSENFPGFDPVVKDRMIKLVEKSVDLLEPPKFKHKKVPRGYGSPPVVVVHSPPRPVTVKDQADWRIPPCISNWKNAKGYVVPLDKRLAADWRGVNAVRVNDSFVELSEALRVAEQKAREAVGMRAKVREEMAVKEGENRAKKLLELACRARAENADMKLEDIEERLQRNKDTLERRRKREARYAAMGKKSKISRDGDRDVSEKVALGMATTGGRGEGKYDQRLFNQEKGMDAGFAKDDAYNVYDTSRTTMVTLFRPKKDADSFTGALERAAPRDKGVEFENVTEEVDPFGLDLFLTEVKKGKQARDRIGSAGSARWQSLCSNEINHTKN